jgi:hypothetical protein
MDDTSLLVDLSEGAWEAAIGLIWEGKARQVVHFYDELAG